MLASDGEAKVMPYMTGFERLARMEELWAGIDLGLEVKFGAEGLRLMPEVKEITDIEVLRAIRQAIRTAASPEELRQAWAGKYRTEEGREGQA
jgi:hypothetical protein